jgi:carbonyl reductase 1
LREQLAHPSSKEALVALANKFVADVAAGTHAGEGWSNSMYGVSKCLESAYTRVLAAELRPQLIMVNACHPG